MTSFQYSFQKVVDLKASQKTQAEWILSEALGVLSAQEQSLHELRSTQSEWEERLHAASMQAVPLTELLVIGQYLEHLQVCIERKLLDIQRAEVEVVQCRSKLAEKMKDEKVWLKAKDRAWERFRHALQIKEQNELDEMATVRFSMTSP